MHYIQLSMLQGFPSIFILYIYIITVIEKKEYSTLYVNSLTVLSTEKIAENSLIKNTFTRGRNNLIKNQKEKFYE